MELTNDWLQAALSARVEPTAAQLALNAVVVDPAQIGPRIDETLRSMFQHKRRVMGVDVATANFAGHPVK